MIADSQLALFVIPQKKLQLGKGFGGIKKAIKKKLLPKEDAVLHGVPLWLPFTAARFKGEKRDHCSDDYVHAGKTGDVDFTSIPSELSPFAQYKKIGFRKNSRSSNPDAIILAMLSPNEPGSFRNELAASGQNIPCLAQSRYFLTPWAIVDYLGIDSHELFSPTVKAAARSSKVHSAPKGFGPAKPAKPAPVVAEVVPAPTRQAIVLPAKRRVEVVQAASSPELIDWLRKECKEPDVLDAWIAFCKQFPGLKWFVVDGVVLFPIPLVEQLKAENPGILSEDVYQKNYSTNFAPKSLRVSLGSRLENDSPEIPLGIKAISERKKTKEVYRLEGYEDNPNAIGFLFEGGPDRGRNYGSAAYEAHQQIGAAMGSTGKFHAVTFSLLYAYLVQGRSNISRQAQRLGAVAIDHGVKKGIEARSENTPMMDYAQEAGAHDPRINQMAQSVQSIESQCVGLNQEMGQLNQEMGQLRQEVYTLRSVMESTHNYAERAAINTTKKNTEFDKPDMREACRLYLKSRHGDGRDRLNDILIIDADGNKTDQCDFHHFNRVKHESTLENCFPVSKQTHARIHSKEGLTHEEQEDLKRCHDAMIEILKLEQQQKKRDTPVQLQLPPP